jgi:hypothetical protein
MTSLINTVNASASTRRAHPNTRGRAGRMPSPMPDLRSMASFRKASVGSRISTRKRQFISDHLIIPAPSQRSLVPAVHGAFSFVFFLKMLE